MEAVTSLGLIMDMLERRRRAKAARRLAKALRPDPESRDRRMAQWDAARRQRYWDAVYGTPQSLRGRVA